MGHPRVFLNLSAEGTVECPYCSRLFLRGVSPHKGNPERRPARGQSRIRLPETLSKPHHVYLVDGSGFIFRAYHALPPLTRADGTPVGAVLGFSNMLLKLLQDTDADHIAVVFDAARTTFRNRIYDQYKAHRPEPPRRSHPAIQAGARGDRRLQCLPHRARRISRPTI